MKRRVGFVLANLFVVAMAMSPRPTLGDAMQDIEAKKADVEQGLREIENQAAANNGDKIPDPNLSLAIGRLETHLRSMDLRLGSLPACQSAPTPPSAQAALEAVRRLIQDEKKAQDDQNKLEEKMREIRKRIRFLEFVQDATKKIVAVKGVVGAGGLALNAIPGMGMGFDALTVIDSALSHMGINPLDPGAPKNIRGLREYRQYLGENSESFQRYAQGRGQEYLRKNPNYRFTEADVMWWAHKYVLDNTPQDKAAKQQEHEDAKKELERLKKRVQQMTRDKSYFGGLLARLEAALNNSKWIQNPRQFERMTAEIKVTIFDDKTGQPLNTATLSVTPRAGTARTEGNPYEFESVKSGSYTVNIAAPGYVKESSQVNVTACQTYPVVIRLKKRPIIKVADIKDEEGRILTDIKVDVSAVATGSAAGSQTYKRTPVLFVVDPGAFTITGTHIGDLYGNILYDPASENVNAEAGGESEVHLVMRKKSALLAIVVEDSLSQQRIDPPPGADEPSVQLEPLEGQPVPTREPYLGNGELAYSHIAAGRYKYSAHFCGWEVQTGEFTVSAEDVKSKISSRVIRLKPTKLDSFTGNVFEHGQSDHIDGFKVTLTGLGPRKGYVYNTVEGKDPDPSVVGLHFGVFIIKGPIYSGRYKLEISRNCYKTLVIDDWWVFCGIEPNARGTFSPQNFHLHPTPEFDAARQQVRAAMAAITKARSDATAAADQIANARRQLQDLPDLARPLVTAFEGVKQSYPTLVQDCKEAAKAMSEIEEARKVIDEAARKVTTLRETAKNLAGVACELSDQAQASTDATKASNHEKNSKQFAAQTRKTAEEAKKASEEARARYDAATQKLAKLKQLQERMAELRKSSAANTSKLQDLRQRLEAAQAAAKSLAQAEAAVTEANRLLGSIRQALQGCADNNPGKPLLDNAVQAANGVIGERKRAVDEIALLKNFLTGVEAVAKRADTLGEEIEKMLQSCAHLRADTLSLDDAKASVDTIEVFALAAQDSVKAADDCAKKATVALSVTVPDLAVFETLAEMQAVLRHAGLVPAMAATKTIAPASAGKRMFAGQDPLAGTKVEKGRTVTILVYQKAVETAAATPAPAPAAQVDEVIVPDLSVFSSLGEMQAVARHAGLDPKLVALSGPASPKSTRPFAYQEPTPGAKEKKGKPLKIFVYQKAVEPAKSPVPKAVETAASPSPSLGEDLVVVPPVKGAGSIDYARTILNQAGFKSSFKAVKPKKKEDELSIADSAPAAGEKAKRGSMVVVFIYQKFEGETAAASASPVPPPAPPPGERAAPGIIPDLIGLTLAQAAARLPINARIGSDEVGDKPPKPEQAFTVFAQDPPAGTKVSADTTIQNVVVKIKRYGSGKTSDDSSTASTGGGGEIAGAKWQGQIASWTGKEERLDGGAVQDWTLTARRRKDGTVDYMISGELLDDVKSAGGKIIAKTALDVWFRGFPDILRAINRITIEPRADGKIFMSRTKVTVMRNGSKTEEPIMRGELSPDSPPKAELFAFMEDDNMVSKVLEDTRKENLEREAINARSSND